MLQPDVVRFAAWNVTVIMCCLFLICSLSDVSCYYTIAVRIVCVLISLSVIACTLEFAVKDRLFGNQAINIGLSSKTEENAHTEESYLLQSTFSHSPLRLSHIIRLLVSWQVKQGVAMLVDYEPPSASCKLIHIVLITFGGGPSPQWPSTYWLILSR